MRLKDTVLKDRTKSNTLATEAVYSILDNQVLYTKANKKEYRYNIVIYYILFQFHSWGGIDIKNILENFNFTEKEIILYYNKNIWVFENF